MLINQNQLSHSKQCT